jgi:gliding motility-associatede transport system auxiliary component
MLKRILGLLGWLGVALVFAAVAISFLKPEWQQYKNALAIAGLVCTLLYILSQWREIAQSFSGRQARFGTLAAASVLVVLAILSAINYLSTRHSKRWDLTNAQQFTLADQTKKVLTGLTKPVRVIVFAPQESFGRYHERLDEYASLSRNFQVEYIDPERKPAVAKPYEPLVAGGTVVFDYAGRPPERVNGDTSEQAMTNALIKVTRGQQNKVYFVQGHNERSADDSDSAGYATVVQFLTATSFGHDNIVLSQVRAIPQDATILVIAGPKSDFFPSEIDLVKGYLARGGKVLCLLDPRDKADAPPLTNLTALLKEWGIGVDDDVVINVPSDDTVKEGQTVDIGSLAALPNTDGTFVLAAKYLPHALTQGLGRVTVVLRMARSISALTDNNTSGHTAQNLFETTASSWGETDIKKLTSGQVAREPGKGDKNGPLSLGAAVSAPATALDAGAPPKPEAAGNVADTPKRETRIAVIGDSDFATNGLLGAGRNADLFLNAVNWLAQQEDLIAIRAKDPEDRRITLTDAQLNWIRLLTIFIVPGFILLAGVQTWWRRR